MPEVDTTLHLDMYRAGKKRRTLYARIRQALQVLLARGDVYGLEWGDPETSPPLAYVRDHFLLPYISQETTALEIGPGGGRWKCPLMDILSTKRTSRLCGTAQ